MIGSSAALDRAYAEELRKAGRLHLLDDEDPAKREADLRGLVTEARASEKRDRSGYGLLAGRSDDEVLARLRGKLRSKASLDAPLRAIAEEVIDSAVEHGYAVAFPVRVGLYPTGSFNSEARRVPAGALLLIDTGYMMLVKQAAGIVTRSLGVAVKDSAMKKMQAKVGRQIGRAAVVRELAELCVAYLATDDAATAPRGRAQTGVQGRLAALITRGAEHFVVGHELGHAIAGHLDRPRSVKRATRVPGLELERAAKSQEEEFEADLYGLRLLTPPSQAVMTTITQYEQFMYRISGAYLFFGLDGLLAAIDARLHGPRDDRLSEHPPAHERAEVLAIALTRDGNVRALEIPRLVQRWFADVTPAVVTEVVNALTPPPRSPRATG